jgi:hypothetical protein
MFSNLLKSMFGKVVLAAVVLGGALSFAVVPNAQAAERIVRREVIVRRDFRDARFDHRFERHPVFARGYFDRFGCWHRY